MRLAEAIAYLESEGFSILDSKDISFDYIVNTPYSHILRFTNSELVTFASHYKWDNRYLELAKEIATWSKDPSTKVSAIVVDDNNRIVSTGFNGFARGVNDSKERYDDRETKYKLVLHAETNAILFARQNLTGCTIYTYPFSPCSRCASMIIQSGIKRVVAPVLPEHLKERWGEDCNLAVQILNEAGVDVDLVK